MLVLVTTAGLEGPHEPSRRWRSGAWGLQCEGPEPGMEEGTAGGRSPGLGPRATSPGSRRPPPPTSPKLSPHRVLAPSLPLASGKSQGASSRKLPSLSCPWPGERRVSGAWWGAWGQTSLGSGRGRIPALLACGEGVPRSAEEAWPAARGESPWRFLLGRTRGNGNRERPPSWPSLHPALGWPPLRGPDQARQPPSPLPPAPRDAASSGATEPVPPPTVPASRPTALGSLVRALLGLSLPPREDAWARDPSGRGGRRVMRQGGDMATRPRASLVPCGGDEITLPAAGEPAPGAVGTSGRGGRTPGRTRLAQRLLGWARPPQETRPPSWRWAGGASDTAFRRQVPAWHARPSGKPPDTGPAHSGAPTGRRAEWPAWASWAAWGGRAWTPSLPPWREPSHSSPSAHGQ